MMLTLSTVVVKITGLVFKIPMLDLLGGEGMGYFNSAYEIYALICSCAVTGLPVAMSVMISSCPENKREKIYRISLGSMLAFGIVGATVMAFFSVGISEMISSRMCVYSIAAFAPAVIFMCMSGACRGYFQGRNEMLPTSVSQLIEAVGKVLFGIALAKYASGRGYPVYIVSAFAVVGVAAASALSLLYLAVKKAMQRKREHIKITWRKGELADIFLELLLLALPITASSVLMSLTKAADMTVILRRLQYIGYSESAANRIYGCYATMCLPLFALAPALISAIALPLIPTLSKAIAHNDRQSELETIESALTLTSYTSMPISVGMSLFSYNILSMIFAGNITEADMMSLPLALLALSVTMSCTVSVVNAILQTYRHTYIPIISMLAGSAAKIALSYILIGNEKFGMIGAPIGTFVCDLIICIIDLYYLEKCASASFSIRRIMLKPAFCAFISILPSFALFKLLELSGSRVWHTVLCITLSAIAYLAASGKDILHLRDAAIKKDIT